MFRIDFESSDSLYTDSLDKVERVWARRIDALRVCQFSEDEQSYFPILTKRVR